MQELENIKNPFNNAPVFYIKETASTMILAREYIKNTSQRAGRISGSVIAAGIQTAGRGRLPDRIWHSGEGENLIFTLILSKKEAAAGFFPLSLTTGLGLSFYLEERFNMEPYIKWPNDILINYKKISGILIESVKDFYLIGIGLNVNQIEFSSDISSSATSLRNETGSYLKHNEELTILLESVKKALREPHKRDEINKRLFLKGKSVRFLSGDPARQDIITGTITGISKEGALLIEADGKIIQCSAGELLR